MLVTYFNIISDISLSDIYIILFAWLYYILSLTGSWDEKKKCAIVIVPKMQFDIYLIIRRVILIYIDYYVKPNEEMKYISFSFVTHVNISPLYTFLFFFDLTVFILFANVMILSLFVLFKDRIWYVIQCVFEKLN